jgi:hypothetical protein
MSVAPTRKPTVEDRERAIFGFVRKAEEGASVREIFEHVTAELDDSVTIQAYYKLIDRMRATAKLEPVDDETPEMTRRYKVADYLHAENALTLDDVYALLEELEPTDAIARVVDAREYFEERRADTLSRAAQAWRDEDPRDLVKRYILDRARELEADLAMLASELNERELETRVAAELREFRQVCYRSLGLSQAAVEAPAVVRPGVTRIAVNESQLDRELALRVFGARAIELVDVNEVEDAEEWNRTAVAGTDGSTHASVLQIGTARAFVDDVGNEVVTFNNSVAYLDLGAKADALPETKPYYSVPMSRSAIDDRTNRGMVMAPFMYRYLSESEYEHTAKCATDVVQWRADRAVFLGPARALGTGSLLPKPKVHIRDGTITPQEREYNHYRRNDEYGDMVREGIAHSRAILDRVISAPTQAVFGGAIKTTQSRFFATILNWYIARGSRKDGATPLDPTWDLTRAAHIPDNEAMSFMLSTLNPELDKGQYFVSFQVMRPFHSLTEFFAQPPTDDPAYWLDYFRGKRDKEIRDHDSREDPLPPYLSTVPDLEDENFVFMSMHADYIAFYLGHTGAEPPPIAPRYEFLEALRRMSPEQAAERVARNLRLLVAAIDRSGLSLDRDHNFLSRKTLVKIIPWVIFEAHEKCKALGRQLDTELRSIVIANLQGIRYARDLDEKDVQFLPLSIRRFVERYRAARADLEQGSEDDSFER